MRFSKWAFLFVCLMHINLFALSSHEKLEFDVKYFWIFPVGKLQISISPYLMDRQDIHRLSATYTSPKWFSWIFHVRGKVNSYVHAATRFPLRYEEFYAYTGHDPENNVLVYDQERGLVYIDRNGQKESKEIPMQTLDPLSTVYFLRERAWTVGDHQEYNLNSHQNNYRFEVNCIEDSKYVHLLGKLTRRDSEEKNPKIKFKVWLTRDDKRLPVKLYLWTHLGPVTLTLRDA
ncbi:MAG: hypothetical protein A3B70_08245 [Deltaproteobacteria bacterium RIFCSPHIGHO2_02_FULL_40_11]|nr:MAG: hypothetical protein A3B70_08245 [Deltaproteobacteria bacterium RIFCSPHIGHO2_02_FULL_40_11]